MEENPLRSLARGNRVELMEPEGSYSSKTNKRERKDQ